MADKQARIVKRVLIASPGDLFEERKIAEEVIADWNIRHHRSRLRLEAVLWEKAAAPESRGKGDGAQYSINHQLVDSCDCAIGMFWTRIGTPTKVAPGGAVEEVQRVQSHDKPVMLYFSNVAFRRQDVDFEQLTQLDAFRASMQGDGLVWEYESHADFRTLLARHLDLHVPQWFPHYDADESSDGSVPQLKNQEALNRYQAILREELGYIRMLGMPGIERVVVNLNDDTFVPLRLSGRQGSQHILYPDEIMRQAFFDRRGRRMLLVIGDPGAGKTTLLKYYALCALDPERSLRLGISGPVTVFYLPLREVLRDLSLPQNLARWSAKHHQTITEKQFDEWLQGDTSLVLLDGLDEISNIEERKEVCTWIDRAWSGFSKGFFVVTSRATGYRKDEGVVLAADYERADVQDFTPEQQERFLKNWFTAAFLKEPCEKGFDEAAWQERQREEALERTKAIIAHLKVEKNRGLRQLAAIPMILQIMAILWKERDFMPESRVKLYDAALDYLLEFRDKRRNIKPLLSATRARQVLGPVSLWMQDSLKKDEAAKREMQSTMQEWLDTLDNPPAVVDFCDYLVKRAGILVESAGSDYLFRHKSFREYLAGVQLKEDRPYEHLNKLVNHFGEDWWEEPLRFFIASVDANVFDAFMQKLFDSPQSENFTIKQQLLLQTIIEEAKGKKVDALCQKLLDPPTSASRQRVILDCLKAIGKAIALDALQEFRKKQLAITDDVSSRAEEVILALGGQLPDIKLLSFRNPNEYNAEYLLIPGGIYRYSRSKKRESVDDLFVAKYPVTNKRYRAFIAFLQAKAPQALYASFTKELNTIAKNNIWGEEFADYLKEGKTDLASLFRSRYDEDRKFGGEDHPVVGVSWYATKAYCLWLSLFEGGDEGLYRLPTELEWEWAAGGKEMRPYPWGDSEPTSKLANYGENVGATTPVGSYPGGATPEGLCDMAGNVWERMENWRNIDAARSLRGGSWCDASDYLRCFFGYYANPDVRYYVIGFRVVRSSRGEKFFALTSEENDHLKI